jgi:hypothetical protein
MVITQAQGEEMAEERPAPDEVIGLGRVRQRTYLTFLLLPVEGVVQSKPCMTAGP